MGDAICVIVPIILYLLACTIVYSPSHLIFLYFELELKHDNCQLLLLHSNEINKQNIEIKQLSYNLEELEPT